MNKKLSKDYLLTNPYSSELEHLYSYAENHHVFNITLMCIKYKVYIMDGNIESINYHEDYINCFTPINKYKKQCVSDTIKNTTIAIIEYYLNDHLWLKGWMEEWSSKYYKMWSKKMVKNSNTMNFYYADPDEAFSYYLFKNTQNTTLLHKI